MIKKVIFLVFLCNATYVKTAESTKLIVQIDESNNAEINVSLVSFLFHMVVESVLSYIGMQNNSRQASHMLQLGRFISVISFAPSISSIINHHLHRLEYFLERATTTYLLSHHKKNGNQTHPSDSPVKKLDTYITIRDCIRNTLTLLLTGSFFVAASCAGTFFTQKLTKGVGLKT